MFASILVHNYRYPLNFKFNLSRFFLNHLLKIPFAVDVISKDLDFFSVVYVLAKVTIRFSSLSTLQIASKGGFLCEILETKTYCIMWKTSQNVENQMWKISSCLARLEISLLYFYLTKVCTILPKAKEFQIKMR